MIKPPPYLIALVFTFFSHYAFSQQLPVDDNGLTARYPFVNSIFNRLLNSSGMDSFYNKLYQLKKTGAGNVSVVHIGDSHVQPDFITGVVRSGLQDFFGNSGRGLVFPYQLAQSNAPSDIISSSPVRWEFNRVAHPEINLPAGVSGYGITTSIPGAVLNFSLRPGAAFEYSFNRVLLFTDSTSGSWLLSTDSSAPVTLGQEQSNAREAILNRYTTSFSLAGPADGGSKSLYGFSLENTKPGVIVHTIGVNGARYDQYNIAPHFWEQLPALHADLYITSLGTNEAQRAIFQERQFTDDLTMFLSKLRATSPGPSILITSAPDSYKGRTSNKVLQALNTTLAAYCNREYIPFWDLYRITNGHGSAYSWSRRGLMSRDRIHFTADGYKLQGQLLMSAIAKGYNSFLVTAK